MEISRGRGVVKWKRDAEQIGVFGFGVRLEGEGEFLGASGRMRGDGVDAGRARGREDELCGVAGDEVGAVGGDDLPSGARELLEWERRASEGVEAPAALDGPGELDGLGQCGLGRLRLLLRCKLGMGEGAGDGFEGRGFVAQREVVAVAGMKQETALIGVGR